MTDIANSTPKDIQASPPREDKANEAATNRSGDINKQLTVLFIFFFLGGVIAISFNTLWLALLVMLVYAIIGLRLPRHLRNTEKFADSLYYMGFLYTLWALFLSFYPLPFLDGELARSSEDILQKFGIALGTSILGLTLRILIIQTQHTVTDQEEEAHQSLARFVEQLNEEVEGSVNALRRLRESTLTAVVEDMRSLQETVNKNLAATNNVFSTAIGEQIAQMTASLTTVKQRLEAISIPENLVSENLEHSVKEIREQLDQLASDVSGSGKTLTASLNASFGELKGLSPKLQRINTNLTKISDITNKASQRFQESTELNSKLAENITAAQNAADTLRSNFEDIGRVVINLKTMLRSDVEQYQDRLINAGDRLNTAVDETSKNVDRLSSTLRESIELLMAKLRD